LVSTLPEYPTAFSRDECKSSYSIGSSPTSTLRHLWKRKRKRGYIGLHGVHRGKEYEYVVVDDDRGTVHTKPLHPRSEAAEAIKVYKVATENMVQMKLREVMTDDHEEWIRPPYQPAPNKLARRSISVLNKTTRTPSIPLG